MGQMRKRHSATFKAKVALEAARQQEMVSELAKEHQVHPVQISQCKRQLLDGIEALFEPGSASRRPNPDKLQAELYEKIGRLQMELAWVKKTRLLAERHRHFKQPDLVSWSCLPPSVRSLGEPRLGLTARRPAPPRSGPT
ncbi:hypothetical protein OJF2_75380 [Aquisphaera giovannonii]|uniref:Transposase n=1 Tax=Aquisphaera giovannonii TaxID=406548 RepID=A0A5B9WE35_9BACT|nr:transposase [Aquisphaera giovannonii]QEH38928.1 hypothetical protein OJF2_75380 [Aquisphaera giovannonii]